MLYTITEEEERDISERKKAAEKSLFTFTDEEKRVLQRSWGEHGIKVEFPHPLKDVEGSWARCKDVYRCHRDPVLYTDGGWMDTFDDQLFEPMVLNSNPVKKKTVESTTKGKKFKKGKTILSNALPCYRT